MITGAPHPVTEITQNHKGSDVSCHKVPPWRILSVLPDIYDYCLLIIGLPNYNTEVL